jgi:hypothetical protein
MLFNVSVGSYRLCIGPLLVVSCEDFRHSNLHSNLAVLICRNCMWLLLCPCKEGTEVQILFTVILKNAYEETLMLSLWKFMYVPG